MDKWVNSDMHLKGVLWIQVKCAALNVMIVIERVGIPILSSVLLSSVVRRVATLPLNDLLHRHSNVRLGADKTVPASDPCYKTDEVRAQNWSLYANQRSVDPKERSG